jgi:hypothetical protein
MKKKPEESLRVFFAQTSIHAHHSLIKPTDLIIFVRNLELMTFNQ